MAGLIRVQPGLGIEVRPAFVSPSNLLDEGRWPWIWVGVACGRRWPIPSAAWSGTRPWYIGPVCPDPVVWTGMCVSIGPVAYVRWMRRGALADVAGTCQGLGPRFQSRTGLDGRAWSLLASVAALSGRTAPGRLPGSRFWQGWQRPRRGGRMGSTCRSGRAAPGAARPRAGAGGVPTPSAVEDLENLPMLAARMARSRGEVWRRYNGTWGLTLTTAARSATTCSACAHG